MFPHCYAVFVLLMQAITHSVANVSSRQAVKLVIVGTGFIEQCWFGLFLGRPAAMKNGVNWGNGFAIGDANTKIFC